MALVFILIGLLSAVLGKNLAHGSVVRNQIAKQHRSRQALHTMPRIMKPSDRVKFHVNGSAIPEVNFDIGASYAGLMPLTTNSSDNRALCTCMPFP